MIQAAQLLHDPGFVLLGLTDSKPALLTLRQVLPDQAIFRPQLAMERALQLLRIKMHGRPPDTLRERPVWPAPGAYRHCSRSTPEQWPYRGSCIPPLATEVAGCPGPPADLSHGVPGPGSSRPES